MEGLHQLPSVPLSFSRCSTECVGVEAAKPIEKIKRPMRSLLPARCCCGYDSDRPDGFAYDVMLRAGWSMSDCACRTLIEPTHGEATAWVHLVAVLARLEQLFKRVAKPVLTTGADQEVAAHCHRWGSNSSMGMQHAVLEHLALERVHSGRNCTPYWPFLRARQSAEPYCARTGMADQVVDELHEFDTIDVGDLPNHKDIASITVLIGAIDGTGVALSRQRLTPAWTNACGSSNASPTEPPREFVCVADRASAGVRMRRRTLEAVIVRDVKRNCMTTL